MGGEIELKFIWTYFLVEMREPMKRKTHEQENLTDQDASEWGKNRPNEHGWKAVSERGWFLCF